jgi:hypothetical protein
MRFADVLEGCGCPVAPRRFDEVLVATFEESCPAGWSDERFTCDTPRADRFVREVWKRLGYRVPHWIVNLRVFNLRKSKLVEKRKRATLKAAAPNGASR